MFLEACKGTFVVWPRFGGSGVSLWGRWCGGGIMGVRGRVLFRGDGRRMLDAGGSGVSLRGRWC